MALAPSRWEARPAAAAAALGKGLSPISMLLCSLANCSGYKAACVSLPSH